MSKKNKVVRRLAYDAVYAKNGKPYEEQLNPFKENTTDHALFERNYVKVYEMYWRLESRCQEMFEVYGDPNDK